jgi:hypothetical protein
MALGRYPPDPSPAGERRGPRHDPNESIVLAVQLPELSNQPDSRESGFRLRYRFRPPIWAQSIFVPLLGQPPSLSQRQGSAARTIPLRAPAIDVLFRPEQEHGLSGEHDVFIPMARRHGNVNDSFR